MVDIQAKVSSDKAYIDSVNWRIKQIQDKTGDRETAKLIEIGENSYSWLHPVGFSAVKKVEFRYGNEDGLYLLSSYKQVLERAYYYWQEGAAYFESRRERLEKIDGVSLIVNLKGAEIHLTQEFIDSRQAHRVHGNMIHFSFPELGREMFQDWLEYLEWKEESYQTTRRKERLLAIAMQVILFEEWEQIRH